MSNERATALPDWARALGRPFAQARLRAQPADFFVAEELGFEPCGDGEHDYLYVEKAGLTTHRLADELARFAGVARKAVGYSGMKDRHAVTRQWFSVQRAPGRVNDWAGFDLSGVSLLQSTCHRRKLKRGVHRRNRFRIVLRELDDRPRSVDSGVQDPVPLTDKLAWLQINGMPNYFGEQRFGWSGSNIALANACFAGRRLSRDKRSIALSAARSLIFNDVLSARVSAGTWNTLLPGDLAGLDGTGSVFAVTDVDDELRSREAVLDVHPTGPLWGAGADRTAGDTAKLEADVAAAHESLRAGLEEQARAARRPTRCRILDLEWHQTGDTLTLDFALGRGSFATALLRELVSYET